MVFAKTGRNEKLIKKVAVERLTTGMFIHDFDCGWLEVPFFRRSLEITDDSMIEKILKHGIREVYIDSSRGLDVSDAPTKDEVETAVQAELEQIVGNEIIPAQDLSIEEELARSVEVRRQAESTVASFMRNVREGKRIDMKAVDETIHKMTDSVFENVDAMLCLSQLKSRDEYTFQHSVNSCIIMLAFGRFIGTNRATAGAMGMGGLLHDIGKMRVSKTVLNKPAKLTDAEFDVMRKHVDLGLEILKERDEIPENVLKIAGEHHERFDGSGYPRGLKGDAISRIGQMSSIVDVYDAITSDRCYHDGMQPAQALRKIYEWSEFHFNRPLVESFIKCIGIYPMGTVVKMESGHLAVVIRGGGEQNALRPMVRLIYDIRNKAKLKNPANVDLSDGKSSDRILCAESPHKWGVNPMEHLAEMAGIAR